MESPSYAEIVRASEPVGYWRLNEGSLNERVRDESCKGHHGRFVNRPTLGEPSAIKESSNSSISFSPQAYIEIPHSRDFSIPTSGCGLSVEVWMRPDALVFPGEGDKDYLHWLGKGDSKRMEWGFRMYSSTHPKCPGRIAAYAWNPQGGLGAGAYYQGDLVQAGSWLHLVACFEHYTDPCVKKTGVQLFVNGQFVQGPLSPGTLYWNEGYWSVVPTSADALLRFATRSATGNSFFSGGLDEIAIYPRVLAPEEIYRHYVVGNTGKDLDSH